MFVCLFRFERKTTRILFSMSKRATHVRSNLLISEIDKLSYRQLQIELKARDLKAAGKSETLRERLRKALIEQNENDLFLDDLDECSICLDRLSFDKITTILTTCLHRYHRICLKKWIESNSEYSLCCPLCRCSLVDDRYNEHDDEKKRIM